MERSSRKHESRVLAQATNAQAMARRFVSSTLDAWGIGDVCGDMPLVTSELVTNAGRHAGSSVDVSLGLTGDRLRLEVSDCSAQPPVVRDAEQARDGGWGMHIVSLLASKWGLESRANGKTVWCELNLET